MKKQNLTSEKELNKIKKTNLPGKKFKVMIARMLNKRSRSMYAERISTEKM